MIARISSALLCAGLAAGCLSSTLEPPPDQVFVNGARVPAGLDAGAYDGAASALGSGARAELDGRWEAARLAYHAVAAQNPGNLRAVMARTRALIAAGRSDQAADLLVAANARTSVDPQMEAATGSVLLAAGHPDKALQYLQRARDLQPLSQATHQQLVAALILAGHDEAAIEELAGTDPADLPDHLLLPVGRSAMLAERLDAAAAVFTEATRRDGTSATPWVELGRAQLLRRDLPAARDALLTALGLSPSRADAFVLLGHVRWLSGDIVRATHCWQTALLDGADPATLGPLLQLAQRNASPSP